MSHILRGRRRVIGGEPQWRRFASNIGGHPTSPPSIFGVDKVIGVHQPKLWDRPMGDVTPYP